MRLEDVPHAAHEGECDQDEYSEEGDAAKALPNPYGVQPGCKHVGAVRASGWYLRRREAGGTLPRARGVRDGR